MLPQTPYPLKGGLEGAAYWYLFSAPPFRG